VGLAGARESCAREEFVDHVKVVRLAISNSLVVLLGLLLGGHVAANLAFHVLEGTGTRVLLVLFESALVDLCR